MRALWTRHRTLVLRALAIVVVWYAGVYLWRQWESASRAELHVSIDVSCLLIASVIVLSTYVLLIETWRRVLAVYGKPISFIDAAISFARSNGRAAEAAPLLQELPRA